MSQLVASSLCMSQGGRPLRTHLSGLGRRVQTFGAFNNAAKSVVSMPGKLTETVITRPELWYGATNSRLLPLSGLSL